MVLYSDNHVVATLNEYHSDVNILNFLIDEKFYHHFLLPKIFDRSVLCHIFSRLGGYDSFELSSYLFEEIDYVTAHEYTEECYQDFLEMVEEYNADSKEWSDLYG